jgi:UDP-N-acetylmuramate--alanine ligase
VLIVRYDLLIVEAMRGQRKVITYGLDERADLSAREIRVVDGAFLFDVCYRGEVIPDFSLPFPGFHNVENALAAMAVAVTQGCTWANMRQALQGFTGIRRRMEMAYRSADKVVIDDYAHHPKELESLIRSARALFPGKQITIVFQPHLYSRTRDLAEGFAAALSLADQVMLLPIYPARETPLPGVESKLIQEKMTGKSVDIIEKSDLLDRVMNHTWEVLLMAGAGDIDRLVAPLVHRLKTRPS